MIAMLQDKQYFNPPFNMKAIGKPNISFLNLLDKYFFPSKNWTFSELYGFLKKKN